MQLMVSQQEWLPPFVFLFLQLTELQLTVDGLERERDFYFGKLRDIEVQCQEEGCADLPVVKKIMDALYATEVGQLKQCYNKVLANFPLNC